MRIKKWKEAMKNEMDALKQNKTWDLMELPQGKKLVGCKWVFIVKYKAVGLLERYKASLVAKGVYSNLWNKISWNICSCCKNEYCKNPIDFNS